MLFFPLQIRTYNTRWASLFYMCGSKSSSVNDLSLRRVEFLLDFMPVWEATYLGWLSQRLEKNVFFLGQPIFYICILQTFSLDSITYFFLSFHRTFFHSFTEHTFTELSSCFPPVLGTVWSNEVSHAEHELPCSHTLHSTEQEKDAGHLSGQALWLKQAEREKQRKYYSSRLHSLLIDLVWKWY